MKKINCLDCRKLDYLDNCDDCKRDICIECLGLIKNNLYCDSCYRKKEELKDSDQIIIAIDGPAGSGKTTVGKELAKRMGYKFIDSGLFYRYFAKICQDNQINHQEEKKVIDFCLQEKENFAQKPEFFLQKLEKQRFSLSQSEVGNLASQFAPIKELRLIIYQLIRSLAQKKRFIVSGRDITFKVLPEAEIKLFLTADLEVRAQRRYQQLQADNKNLTLEEVKDDLAKRDIRDQINILTAEKNALKIDTTKLTLEESIEKIRNLIKEKN